MMVAYPALGAQQHPVESDEPPVRPNGIAVTNEGTVELHLADRALAEVLQLLSLESRQNIITSPRVTGNVTASLYDATFEEALEAILVANGAGYRKIGKFIFVYTNEELAEMSALERGRFATQVYTLNYINASDASKYITPMLREGESVTPSPDPDQGIASAADDGGGDSNAAQDFVIITASSESHAGVDRLLKQIDVRPQQVLIEATILRAELSDENALGIDFTIVGGVDLELLNATSAGIQNLALGQLPQERFELFNAIGKTDFTSAVPNGGVTFGVIKDHVALFIRALEQVTDTTVLANPKVLALNKQKGQVIVGRRDGFLTTTVTETQTVQTVEFLETGTQLIFRPFIGTDGFIRMELHPEDSVGFVNANGLPSEQTTEVTTNVIVRDGETILIGGLFREVTTSKKGQVPVVGNIPVIGSLFRSKDETTSREEVIILLTVHVVKNHEAYAGESQQLLQDIERIRVGMRRGLMWHGHERLAQMHYHKAVDLSSAGETDKALWHARMALHCHPRFLPAIRLRERILSEREWDDDGTSMRDLIYRIIAQERGYPRLQFGRRSMPENVSGSTGNRDDRRVD